jgi:hypothetical protein
VPFRIDGGQGNDAAPLISFSPYSPKCVEKEFSEVGQEFIGNSSALAKHEGARSNPAGVAKQKGGCVGLRRIILLVTVAAMLAVMTVFAAGAALAEPGGGTCIAEYNPSTGNFIVQKTTPSSNVKYYTTDHPPTNCEVH